MSSGTPPDWPAIFREASTNSNMSLVFQFGGQGLNYFEELTAIVNQNTTAVGVFEVVAEELKVLGAGEDVHQELPRGLELMSWLRVAPPAEYLERCAVSFPLIGLTQMLMYHSTLKRAGIDPDEARHVCAGGVGHSSGVCAAVVAATASSFKHLESLIVDTVRYLFWHGVRCQQEAPLTIGDPSRQKDGEKPSPMLSVRGLPLKVLQRAVDTYNKGADPRGGKALKVGLINGTDAGVVVGAVEACFTFSAGLLRQIPPATESQGRVPFSQRKPEYSFEFLKVTAPFHSPVIANASSHIMEDAKASPLFAAVKGTDLSFPVYSTVDGSDLREIDGPLLPRLVAMQVEEVLDWMKTTSSIGEKPTIIVDFGPGGKRGVAAISSRYLGGRAVTFVHASPDGLPSPAHSGTELLVSLTAQVLLPKPWEEDFAPRVVRVGNSRDLVIDNRFSRLLGAPPLLVAGMTPWSHFQQVGATNKAGYISELAGGGIPLPHLFEKEIRELARIIPSGQGISCNLLFLNPYLWGFQFPLIEKLCARGEPIDSFTVAAGVPSPEKAAEIVAASKRSSLRYMSFKPGTVDAIVQVLQLAKLHPDVYMVIQFTGGRAGGHHSFEDQYDPLLRTYAQIRTHKNVLLVVGGGLGDADSSWDFLSGEWSLRFGCPKMPCDGVLFGSRVMATQEAATCDKAKDLIVAASGVVDQADWENSYKDDAGGVITVLSELGEPIHVINNRCARCWREFDVRFFTKNGETTKAEEMVHLLEADKSTVIKMLNEDYQKPWFGKKDDGTFCDLGAMTYKEVAVRLTELHWYAGDMPGMEEPRWLDVSYRERVFDWLHRTEERFCRSSRRAMLHEAKQLERKPHDFINVFFETYTAGANAVLAAADVDYFISSICGIPTRKPINFIPEISAMFKRYFKSDSLWYSEQIEAVPGFDAEKAFIISGPVATKYTIRKNESIKELLDGIRDGIISHIKQDEVCHVQELPGIADANQLASPSSAKMVELLGFTGASYQVSGVSQVEIVLGEMAPDFRSWTNLLTNTNHSASLCGVPLLADGVWSGARWLNALLVFPKIQRGDRRAPSFLPRMMRAVSKGRVKLEVTETDLIKCLFFLPGNDEASICLNFRPNTEEIVMTFTYFAPNESQRGAFPLELKFKYCPQYRGAPIHEDLSDRNSRIQQFYSRLWLGEDLDMKVTKRGGLERVFSQSGVPQVSSQAELQVFPEKGQVQSQAFQDTVQFSRNHVRRFCLEVGQNFDCYISSSGKVLLPLDFAIVVCWKAMIRSVLSDSRIGSVDLLRLLHLENRFKLLAERRLQSTDTFDNTFSLVEIFNASGGKRVTTRGTVSHEGTPWVIVTSTFFIPADITSSEEMIKFKGKEFETVNKSFVLNLESESQKSVLLSKKWFKFDQEPKVGDILRIHLISNEVRMADGTLEVFAAGRIFSGSGVIAPVGRVSYRSEGVAKNALVSFLDRTAVDYPPYKDIVGYEMLKTVDETLAPTSMDRYSSISADINPIHTDPYFARLGGLEQPIVHGMWLSANARRVIATHVGEREKCGTVYFRCFFVDKVLPGERLHTSVRHVGMRNGLIAVSFETVNSLGTVVCSGFADIEQPKCSFIFTGQGSQKVGMGMDLFETSEVSKRLWREADAHFVTQYGLSLLEIVRTNPKEKTVFFGGPQGAKRREFYMSLTKSADDGIEPLFPSIKKSSTSYTFRSPSGLLSATQFTQPALILLEMAQYMDVMRELCFPSDFMFAGHSLGEYAAICSVTGCMEVTTLMDLIFMRGMTMQSVVPRDAEGKSDFGMVAVDPTRVAKGFSDKSLSELVDAIDAGGFLQIVNYNVEPTQYVIAGDILSLTALMHACNSLKANKDLDTASIVLKSWDQAKADKNRSESKFVLKRGVATIPLEGIDVPFHSRFLRTGVQHFRNVLQKSFIKEKMAPFLFEKLYVPNLVAKPFSLSKEFALDVQSVASSPVLEALLPDWDAFVKKDRAEATMVMVIELLAYQFASPVRWIETVDVIVRKNKCRRVVELGPSPVLSSMLKTTMAKNPKFFPLHGSVESLSFSMDTSKLYFSLPNKGPSARDHVAGVVAQAQSAQETLQHRVTPTLTMPTPASAIVAASPVATASDFTGVEVNVAPSALDVIRVILAARFAKPIDSVETGTTIKKLSGGKSALQNEIVGDLGKEFADADGADLEDAADVSLAQLAMTVQSSYKKLGKISNDMLNHMVQTKLPAGSTVSKLRSSFQEEYILGVMGMEGALIAALVLEPSDRLDPSALHGWRASVIQHYGTYAGTSVGSRSFAGAGGTGGSVAAATVVDPRVAAKLNAMVADLASVYREYLDQDPLRDSKTSEIESALRGADARMAAVTGELGDVLISGVQPYFRSERIREYNSWWALARMDALILWHKLGMGEADVECEARIANRMTSECQKLLHWLADKSEGSARVRLQILAQTPIVDVGKYVEVTAPTQPSVEVKRDGSISYEEVSRDGQPDMSAYIDHMEASKRNLWLCGHGADCACDEMCKAYFDALRDITKNGLSFLGQVALITGSGPASISTPVVKSLLAGGCTVICSFRGSRYDWFQQIYAESAGAQGRLICVPFNCGSQKDLDSTLNYIYNTLGLDIDFCLPFAALSENGRSVADLDSKSELAHRIMLTNVLRLVGKIKTFKEERHILGKVCVVVVPLSPNRGDFGFDGLYAESKLGLESLFMKWSSEKLQDYIAIVGAEIGWTRGTGLMNANNQVTMGVEDLGMRTFTVAEMSFNLMGLLHPEVVAMAQLQPVVAKLTGGMEMLVDLAGKTAQIRANLAAQSSTNRAIHNDQKADRDIERFGSEKKAADSKQSEMVNPRAVPGQRFLFPQVPAAGVREKLGLRNMIDPASVVVITGFGEVGPWGNAATRWEMEVDGEFSIEGCIEMAWMMGFTRYFNGRMTDPAGKPIIYSGWVDAATNELLADWEVKSRFEKQILQHTGIRVLEPELFWEFDPQEGTKFYHTVILERDLDVVEVADEETAREFKRMHGDGCDIFREDGTWFVHIKKGTVIYVPRALRRDRWVAGQIPTGWDAKTYGVPDDIIKQVDRVTLFTLVSFMESLISSGVTDPYEFYKYVHVSKVGNSIGSGIGGLRSLREMFVERKFGDAHRVQGDVLQETFINTTAAWINMLLMSCSGPIKTPVGACATAMESFSIAVDTIVTGQAKMMLAGAYDDLSEESMHEFANMKATANTDEEMLKDRLPSELSRPMSSSRGGFVESHGAGVVVLMAGDLAVDMGVPIYGVVGLVHAAMDREGRSVPAPGKGVLTIVSEGPAARFSPALSLSYRRQQLKAELHGLEGWREAAIKSLEESNMDERREAITQECARLKSSAQRRWGTDWWKGHPDISPLRGALATWGLTVDDIGLCSCHGTSTKLNDKNESNILNVQMETLGRKEGNPLLVISQKWLTGHPKGPAFAWQVNGAMQAILTGRVPGNRNLDNVDPVLRENKHLLYTSATLNVGPLKAAIITSFGFGQAGGQMLLVHPDHFLATLSDSAIESYISKRSARLKDSYKFHEDVIAGRRKFVEVKNAAPYADEEVQSYLLRQDRRVGQAERPVSNSNPSVEWVLPSPTPTMSDAVADVVENCLGLAVSQCGERGASKVGVDVESISNPCFLKQSFVDRNYTEQEKEQCGTTIRSFAGLWAGKEAVAKVLGNSGVNLKSAGASLRDIELTRSDGIVSVQLHGYAADEATRVGVGNVKVSLSYTESIAVAAAVSE